MAHTPGPWIVYEGGGGHRHLHSVRAESDTGPNVAEVDDLEHPGLDNARLIAAAPDMLNALQLLMDSELVDNCYARNAVIDAAEAAIVKATGVKP